MRQPRTLFVVLSCASFVACTTAVRLEVAEGQVFRLTEAADPGPQTVSLVDRRSSVVARGTRAPLFVTVGEEEVLPPPVEALRAEIAHLQTLIGTRGDAARAVRGKSLSLEGFTFTIAAADVSQPRQGVPTGAQPPAVEAFGAGVRSLAQAIGGGADITIQITVTAEGRTVEGTSRFRATASPGNSATTAAFRNAVASTLAQLAAAKN